MYGCVSADFSCHLWSRRKCYTDLLHWRRWILLWRLQAWNPKWAGCRTTGPFRAGKRDCAIFSLIWDANSFWYAPCDESIWWNFIDLWDTATRMRNCGIAGLLEKLGLRRNRLWGCVNFWRCLSGCVCVFTWYSRRTIIRTRPFQHGLSGAPVRPENEWLENFRQKTLQQTQLMAGHVGFNFGWKMNPP